MKTLDISKATESLARYTRSLRREPVVVTRKGKPVAALMPIDNADVEIATLSTNPRFLALIERARVRHEKEGGLDIKQVRERFGLQSTPPGVAACDNQTSLAMRYLLSCCRMWPNSGRMSFSMARRTALSEPGVEKMIRPR